MEIKLISRMILLMLLMTSVEVTARTSESAPAKTKSEVTQAPEDQKVYTADRTSILLSDRRQNHFTVQLKSNPTTGYSWFLRDYNSDLIIPVRHQFVPPTSGAAGASGTERYTFRMNDVGFVMPMQTKITFVYVRPWEMDRKDTKVTFDISTQSSR